MMWVAKKLTKIQRTIPRAIKTRGYIKLAIVKGQILPLFDRAWRVVEEITNEAQVD